MRSISLSAKSKFVFLLTCIVSLNVLCHDEILVGFNYEWPWSYSQFRNKTIVDDSKKTDVLGEKRRNNYFECRKMFRKNREKEQACIEKFDADHALEIDKLKTPINYRLTGLYRDSSSKEPFASLVRTHYAEFVRDSFVYKEKTVLDYGNGKVEEFHFPSYAKDYKNGRIKLYLKEEVWIDYNESKDMIKLTDKNIFNYTREELVKKFSLIGGNVCLSCRGFEEDVCGDCCTVKEIKDGKFHYVTIYPDGKGGNIVKSLDFDTLFDPDGSFSCGLTEQEWY